MSIHLEALAAYPREISAGPWTLLADAGGFSGAKIWRSPAWRLKASPRSSTFPERLRQIHQWIQRAAHLDFVPRVATTIHGDTLVDDGRWLWEIVSWMPGEPLLRSPTPARLAEAGRALASLHSVWQAQSRSGPSEAVTRRIDVLQNLPDAVVQDVVPLRDLVVRLAPRCLERLAPWRDEPMPLHPCLCDVWTEHVLFENDVVCGIIDFGSARLDHFAVDLARLLGDCLGGEQRLWQPLLDAYSVIRPLSPRDYQLIAVFESTGAVAALGTWIDRLKNRPPTPKEAARLTKIVARCGIV